MKRTNSSQGSSSELVKDIGQYRWCAPLPHGGPLEGVLPGPHWDAMTRALLCGELFKTNCSGKTLHIRGGSRSNRPREPRRTGGGITGSLMGYVLYVFFILKDRLPQLGFFYFYRDDSFNFLCFNKKKNAKTHTSLRFQIVYFCEYCQSKCKNLSKLLCQSKCKMMKQKEHTFNSHGIIKRRIFWCNP